jgi:hypothetical protein
MRLDSSFSRDITKIANGDDSREARIAFRQVTRAVALSLSNTKVSSLFDGAIKEHGRVPVAICTAATIYARRDRLSVDMVAWAIEVLKLWTNRSLGGIGYAVIDDGLHPTRIEEYAGPFIRLTTADEE